jgi:SAM-dependent methyltransferase
MNNIFRNQILRDGIYFSQNCTDVCYPKGANELFNSIEDGSFWYTHRNNSILKLIQNFFVKGEIFDIGGGNGYVSKALQENGYEVVLIEPDIKGVVNAKKRGVRNVVCASFDDLEWTEQKMNNAALFDVIEHVKNDHDFIRQLGMHVADDGLLFVTVPSHNILFSIEDEHDGHFRRYSLAQIKEVLVNNGFEILYGTYIFTYLYFPILFFRVLPSVLKLGRYKSIEVYDKAQCEEKYSSEHQLKNPIIKFLIDLVHKFELNQISQMKSIRFGATCLIVAKKTHNSN